MKDLEKLFKDEEFVDLVNNLTSSDLEENTKNMEKIIKIITYFCFGSIYSEPKFIALFLDTEPNILEYFNKIPDRMFSGCDWLINITLPNNIESIGDRAFSYCANLTSITIPDSVTSIGDSAFYYCYSLTNITIPNSVTSIGDRAFYDCDKLKITTNSDYVKKYCRENNIKYKRV